MIPKAPFSAPALSLAFALACPPLPPMLQERTQLLAPQLAPHLCWETWNNEDQRWWRLRWNHDEISWPTPIRPWKGELGGPLAEDLQDLQRRVDSLEKETWAPNFKWILLPSLVLQGLIAWTQGPWKPSPQWRVIP